MVERLPPVRLAFVTDTYLPEINGVTTVLRMIRQLIAGRGHELLFLAPDYPACSEPDRLVIRRASVPCPSYPAVRLSSPFGPDVFRALDRFVPELIHVVTEGPLGAIGRRYALKRARPLVTSFHTDFPRYAARYLGPWAEKVAQIYLRRFHQPAVITQTPSAVSRADLVALGLPRTVSSFALPLASSTFRYCQALTWQCYAAFAGALYGIDIGIAGVTTLAVTSILMSFSVPGIPGARSPVSERHIISGRSASATSRRRSAADLALGGMEFMAQSLEGKFFARQDFQRCARPRLNLQEP